MVVVMNPEHDRLFELISKGSIKALSTYLQRHRVDLNAISREGWTPLMVACDQECFDIVKLLLDSGADVNRRSSDGFGPLHIAVDAAIDSDCKHKLGRRVDDAPVDIVVYLLWKGADPFSKTNDGQTPADIARGVRSAKLVHLLETYERAHNKVA
jgi:uncharacterized protein